MHLPPAEEIEEVVLVTLPVVVGWMVKEEEVGGPQLPDHLTRPQRLPWKEEGEEVVGRCPFLC